MKYKFLLAFFACLFFSSSLVAGSIAEPQTGYEPEPSMETDDGSLLIYDGKLIVTSAGGKLLLADPAAGEILMYSGDGSEPVFEPFSTDSILSSSSFVTYSNGSLVTNFGNESGLEKIDGGACKKAIGIMKKAADVVQAACGGGGGATCSSAKKTLSDAMSDVTLLCRLQ